VIPFVDLKSQYLSIKPEVDAAVLSVFDSTQYVLGSFVASFEQAFSKYSTVEHTVAVNTGTSALHLAFLAAGIGAGDEVITTPFTFVATVSAIDYARAKPVFVDIDPESLTIDPARIEAAITPRTKAIVPVHLYGRPADMDPILEIGRRRNVLVIEDACQAHGAEYKGRRAGSMGQMGCFSFYPGKNLGAYGDAGMVVSGDGEFAARVRQIANHGGGANKYDNVVVGTNSRLDTLQAAVLRVKLRHLDQWNAERRERAQAYTRALADVPGLTLPRERAGARSVWHLYTILTAERDALQQRLKADGISTAVHYPRPIHLQPAMAAAGGAAGDLPVSEQLSREVLCLPLYPELAAEDVDRVAAAVRSFRTASMRA
jgi:dTDP-4-amino-4,6-dideoxygalactose transaminase